MDQEPQEQPPSKGRAILQRWILWPIACACIGFAFSAPLGLIEPAITVAGAILGLAFGVGTAVTNPKIGFVRKRTARQPGEPVKELPIATKWGMTFAALVLSSAVFYSYIERQDQSTIFFIICFVLVSISKNLLRSAWSTVGSAIGLTLFAAFIFLAFSRAETDAAKSVSYVIIGIILALEVWIEYRRLLRRQASGNA